MDIIWYFIIIIIVIFIIYFIIKLLSGEKFTNQTSLEGGGIKSGIKSYLSEMIQLQNKQVELTSNIYNNITNMELKNVADFIMQNIPPTTKIMEGLLLK